MNLGNVDTGTGASAPRVDRFIKNTTGTVEEIRDSQGEGNTVVLTMKNGVRLTAYASAQKMIDLNVQIGNEIPVALRARPDDTLTWSAGHVATVDQAADM